MTVARSTLLFPRPGQIRFTCDSHHCALCIIPTFPSSTDPPSQAYWDFNVYISVDTHSLTHFGTQYLLTPILLVSLVSHPNFLWEISVFAASSPSHCALQHNSPLHPSSSTHCGKLSTTIFAVKYDGHVIVYSTLPLSTTSFLKCFCDVPFSLLPAVFLDASSACLLNVFT